MISFVRQLLINGKLIRLIDYKLIHLNAIKLNTKRELKLKQTRIENTLSSVRNLVFNNNNNTNNIVDWHSITKQLIEQKILFSANFELSLMSAFQYNYETDLNINFDETCKLNRESFLSLNKFLKENVNLKKNTIALSRYCLFMSDYEPYLDETMRNEIKEITDYVIDRYFRKIELIASLRDCLMALSKSSKDNCVYALELLPKFPDLLNDTICVNNIISAVFKHQLYREGFNLINSSPNQLRYKLNSDTIKQILNAIIEFRLSETEFIEIINFFSKNFSIFNEQFKPLIEKIMSNYGFNQISNVKIDHSGLCAICHHSLQQLTDDEFKVLKTNIQSIVISKEDNPIMTAFYRYHLEMNVFSEFLKSQKKPFDLVIDGLNISYGTSASYVPDSKKLRAIVAVYPLGKLDQRLVDFFKYNHILEQFSNILLIGRSHMSTWKKLSELLNNNKDRLCHFFAIDKAKDDSYVLLAASQNINTKIASNDFYSEYRDKMVTKDLRQLFHRWLLTRQIFFGDTRFLNLPNACDYTINITKDAIHIPLIKDLNSVSNINDINNRELILKCRAYAINWLCCRKKTIT